MKRLHWVFLAVLALVASLAFVQVDDTSSDVAYTLTVLHNNDGESQLVNAGSGLEDFGGVARFARLVSDLRAGAAPNDTDRGVVVLSSGDNFLAGLAIVLPVALSIFLFTWGLQKITGGISDFVTRDWLGVDPGEEGGLTNAAKFTEVGAITVRAWPTDGEVRVSVSDTGIGIPPEDRERIFERFEQGTMEDGRRPEGAGLGLALSKEFVEMHGGQIWVESEVSRGSTFTFSLPLNRGALPA